MGTTTIQDAVRDTDWAGGLCGTRAVVAMGIELGIERTVGPSG
ncbi:hypothetical protein [Demequina muriae]|uniref:Uncharacterized protein n=1 Tax=Demequina muriae TaxID=3051664 RepID=A0ABT8GH58_9MICO|nr:hypothetical protein [Demequina sp. EGI L300058]MDN4480606.1 hypothetical protein [Demequina sp. EGI L300058]